MTRSNNFGTAEIVSSRQVDTTLLGKPPSKRRKYGNRKVEVDGIKFDSVKEANHYNKLKFLESAGKISKLRTQVSYDLIVNAILICRYVADFVYEEDGATLVVDAKGFRTRAYVMKKKLMKACHNIDLVEV